MSHIKNQYWVRKIAKILKSYIDNISATIASCCRIVLMSSFSTAIKTKEILEFKQFSRCCILGNGPTLINAIRDSEVILLLTELVDYGIEVFNLEEDKFQRWMKKPNYSLGNNTPESLLDSNTGIQEVRNCLNRIEFGNFA